MRTPLIHSLLLALAFLSTSCGDAKFSGKGKKKDRKQADVVVDPEPPVTCNPGETCVVVDPDKCKAGEKDCPKPVPTPTPTPTPTITPVPPHDDCKGSGKDCPVPPVDDCDDEPGQNPSQNPGQNTGKECPSQNDDAGQHNPAQHK